MIKPISFGSTYLIKNKNEENTIERQVANDELKNLCKKRRIPYNEKAFHNEKHNYGDSTYDSELTIVSPDKFDGDIEAVCFLRGVDFTKRNIKELMTPEAIMKRVKPAPEGYQTALLNVPRFYNSMTRQEDANLYKARVDYRKHKDEVMFMLRSGEEIPASTMEITTWYGDKPLADIIRTGIAEEDSLIIELKQQTKEPDQCIFIAMENMGMKAIPVYVTEEGYKVAKSLGIVL